MKIQIWTDGSCKGNGKKDSYGGWAYVILIDGKIVHKDSHGVDNTTNNQMELSAVIAGIQALDKIKDKLIDLGDFNPLILQNINIEVFSDSAYLQRCWEEKWYKRWKVNGWVNSNREPVKNRELWEMLIPFFEDSRFTFKKVKGHSGVSLNEMVDQMATTAAEIRSRDLEEILQ